jgi:hypothetical protein
MKRIRDNVILNKSPLNLDTYTVEGLRPEHLFADKRYNVSESLDEAAQIQKKLWKLSSMDIMTDRSLLSDLNNAPFSFNNIRETNLEHTFGLPLLSTVEMMKSEGITFQMQESYPSIENRMSYSNSSHQTQLETLISEYKDLKNHSSTQLQIYSESLLFYGTFLLTFRRLFQPLSFQF